MAWYTTIYPDLNKFSWKEYSNLDELSGKINELDNKLNDLWDNIYMLVFASPISIIPKDCKNSIEYVKELFNKSWYEYLSVYSQQYKLYRIFDLWQEQLEHEEYIQKYPDGDGPYDLWGEDIYKLTPEQKKQKVKEERANWRPSCHMNHFEYSTDPEDGVKDCTSDIIKIKQDLLGYVIAIPKDVCPEEDEEGSKIDPHWHITHELRDLKEWLEDRLSNLEFSKLCVQYWDTHTVG